MISLASTPYTKKWREITEEDRRRLYDAAIKAGRLLREDMRRLQEQEEEAKEKKRQTKKAVH